MILISAFSSLGCCTSARPCVTVKDVNLDAIEKVEAIESDNEEVVNTVKKSVETSVKSVTSSDHGGIIPPPPTWGRCDP